MALEPVPDLLSDFAHHVRTNTRRRELESQARAAAEACIAHEEAGDHRKATAAKRRATALLRQEMRLDWQLRVIEAAYQRRRPG